MKVNILVQGLVHDNELLLLLAPWSGKRGEEGERVCLPVAEAVACVGLAVFPLTSQWGRPRSQTLRPRAEGGQEKGYCQSSPLYLFFLRSPGQGT